MAERRGPRGTALPTRRRMQHGGRGSGRTAQPGSCVILHAMEIEPGFIGRTFDDFLFRPRRGVVRSRGEVRLTTRLSTHVPLELPIVSANMDSVTGAGMARTMALEGGLGFVHRAMPIDAQSAEVERVKR